MNPVEKFLKITNFSLYGGVWRESAIEGHLFRLFPEARVAEVSEKEGTEDVLTDLAKGFFLNYPSEDGVEDVLVFFGTNGAIAIEPNNYWFWDGNHWVNLVGLISLDDEARRSLIGDVTEILVVAEPYSFSEAVSESLGPIGVADWPAEFRIWCESAHEFWDSGLLQLEAPAIAGIPTWAMSVPWMNELMIPVAFHRYEGTARTLVFCMALISEGFEVEWETPFQFIDVRKTFGLAEKPSTRGVVRVSQPNNSSWEPLSINCPTDQELALISDLFTKFWPCGSTSLFSEQGKHSNIQGSEPFGFSSFSSWK